MDAAAIVQYIIETFHAVETTDAFGYIFFFHGPDRKLPFATISASDNDHDRVSNLDRPGVFRLNISVSKKTFQSLFGTEGIILNDYDYTTLDLIMPHPVYSAQFFVSVLNPSEATFRTIRHLLSEAYSLAVSRQVRREKDE